MSTETRKVVLYQLLSLVGVAEEPSDWMSDGDLYVSGSGMLVRAMLDDGLVDGLHLFVYPLTRGEGPRLFPDGAAARKLSLEGTEAYDNGVVYLHYRPQA